MSLRDEDVELSSGSQNDFVFIQLDGIESENMCSMTTVQEEEEEVVCSITYDNAMQYSTNTTHTEHELEQNQELEQESMQCIEEQILELDEEQESCNEHGLLQCDNDMLQHDNGALQVLQCRNDSLMPDEYPLHHTDASLLEPNVSMHEDNNAALLHADNDLYPLEESSALHEDQDASQNINSSMHDASLSSQPQMDQESLRAGAAPTFIQSGERTCRIVRLEYRRDLGRRVAPSVTTLGTIQRAPGSASACRGLQVPRSSTATGNEVKEPLQKKIKLQVKGVNGALSSLADRACATTNGAAVLEIKPLPRKNDPSLTSCDVTKAWFTTKDEKRAFLDTGGRWKQGQWTREEVEHLQNNILQYCRERSLVDPAEIIYSMTKDERKDFYRSVAVGLQRPLFSVYRRVVRMYDQRNHRGKYSPDDIDALRQLRQKHGSDWATIGSQLGRSASSVKDRCRLLNDACNTGKWCPEEEERLSAAVHRLSGALLGNCALIGQHNCALIGRGQSVTSGLSWAQVADHVGTRSEKQCRTKWLNYLNWKLTGGAEWGRHDQLLLLDRLSLSGALDEADIEWTDIASDWPSVRSPQWLRGKWWSMKRHLPDHSSLPFTELVERLRGLQTRGARSGQGGSGASLTGPIQVDLGSNRFTVISDEGVMTIIPADSITTDERSTANLVDVQSDAIHPEYTIANVISTDQSGGSYLIDASQSAGSFLSNAVQQYISIGDDQSDAAYLNVDESRSVYLIRSSDLVASQLMYSVGEQGGASGAMAPPSGAMAPGSLSCASEQEIVSSDVIESVDDPTSRLTPPLVTLTPDVITVTPDRVTVNQGFSRSLSNDGTVLLGQTDPLLTFQNGED